MVGGRSGCRDWTHQAVYEVMADGRSLQQDPGPDSSGDEWHTIAEGLKLEPGQHPLVRVRNAGGGGVLVADALHVFSAERYNDGTEARQIVLEPMDGIVFAQGAGARNVARRPPPMIAWAFLRKADQGG